MDEDTEVMSDGEAVPESVSRSNSSCSSLLCLPEELFFKCTESVGLQDLVSLDLVNKDLHGLLQQDAECWKNCVQQRCETACSEQILERAACIAGGWKRLCIEAEMARKENKRWVPATESMIKAAIERVSRPNGNKAQTETREDTSIVLLIDGSSSISDEDFVMIRSFCDQLLHGLDRDAQVCLIQFNQNVVTEIPMARLDLESNSKKVLGLAQAMGSTDIPAALEFAASVLKENCQTQGRKVLQWKYCITTLRALYISRITTLVLTLSCVLYVYCVV